MSIASARDVGWELLFSIRSSSCCCLIDWVILSFMLIAMARCLASALVALSTASRVSFWVFCSIDRSFANRPPPESDGDEAFPPLTAAAAAASFAAPLEMRMERLGRWGSPSSMLTTFASTLRLYWGSRLRRFRKGYVRSPRRTRIAENSNPRRRRATSRSSLRRSTASW